MEVNEKSSYIYVYFLTVLFRTVSGIFPSPLKTNGALWGPNLGPNTGVRFRGMV